MAERRLAFAAGALTVALGALTAWAWTARSPAGSSAGGARDSQPVTAATIVTLDGAGLFHAKGCATCHDGPGVRATVGLAPSLAAVADWPAERRRSMPLEDYLRESILEPGAYRSSAFVASGPLTAMPGIPVSADELDALVAFLLGD
jgi:cytochrome c1